MQKTQRMAIIMNRSMRFFRKFMFTVLVMLCTVVGIVTFLHISDYSALSSDNSVVNDDFWNREHGEFPAGAPSDSGGVTVNSDSPEADNPPNLNEGTIGNDSGSTDEPGAGDSGTGDPGADDPGADDPGTGDPGTGDPGTGDPGTGDPGAGDPGTGDPGKEEPKQFSVTIENPITNTAGDGLYLPGVTVTINVGGVDGPDGEKFNKWCVVLGDVTIANKFHYFTTFEMPESDVVLRIIWGSQQTEEDISVSFFRNHSPEDIEVNIVTVESNTIIGESFPPNPTRTGFTFIGWNMAQDGLGASVTSGTKVGTVDFNVYAQWSENPQPPRKPPSKPPAKPPEPPPEQDGEDQVENIIQGGNNQAPDNNNQGIRSSLSSPVVADLPSPVLSEDALFNAIIDALESARPSIQISAGELAILSRESIQLLRESGKILEIELPNGLVIRIDSSSITSFVTALNINIDVEITGQETIVHDVLFPANSIVIAPSAHGEFGLAISFDISAKQLADAGLDASNIRLFHINIEGVVTEAGIVRLNDDGSVTITISHASLYLLSEEEPILVAPIIDTAIDDAPALEDPIVEAAVSETAASEPVAARPVAAAVPPPAPEESGFNLWIIIIAGAAVVLVGVVLIILRGKRKKNDDTPAAEPAEAPQEA